MFSPHELSARLEGQDCERCELDKKTNIKCSKCQRTDKALLRLAGLYPFFASSVNRSSGHCPGRFRWTDEFSTSWQTRVAVPETDT
ncbi:hypothetical protein IWQ53_005717 [Labrenzia sp. EL_162]|nr:hypothetical protein [Labrenzia sp. EL_162]